MSKPKTVRVSSLKKELRKAIKMREKVLKTAKRQENYTECIILEAQIEAYEHVKDCIDDVFGIEWAEQLLRTS